MYETEAPVLSTEPLVLSLKGGWQLNTMVRVLCRTNPKWIDAFEPATMAEGSVLIGMGHRPREIFFPFEGLVSLMTETDDGDESMVQVAMLGQDDVVGAIGLLGTGAAPYRAIVHIQASGMKVSAQVARRILREDPRSRAVVSIYVENFIAEMTQSYACASRYNAEQRLAGWLLRTSHVLGSNALPVTHKFAGSMLGLRRATATLAVQALEKKKLIGSEQRGRIDLWNRPGLMEVAGPGWAKLHAYRLSFTARMAKDDAGLTED